MHFADGRVFHDWVWGSVVEHACAPDDYTGVLGGVADRWTVRWEARGPAKDYRLDSVLERRTGTASVRLTQRRTDAASDRHSVGPA